MTTIEMIRNTYLRLTGGNYGYWVELADLRPLLVGDSDDLVEALRLMGRAPEVTIAPKTYQLTDEDHAAAIIIGGVAKHLIAIEG